MFSDSTELQQTQGRHTPLADTDPGRVSLPAAFPSTSQTLSAVADNDIGLAVGEGVSLSAEQRAKFIKPWCPSLEQDYPYSVRTDRQQFTKQGTERRRRLLARHMTMFPWLAVSKVQGKEGAYCVPCVLSLTATGVGGRSRGHGQVPGKLVTKPLNRFDDLTGKDGDLTRHQQTSYHQESVVALEDFRNRFVQHVEPDIQSSVSIAHKKQVEENRAFLVPIIDTILTCARQNIAFRGHRGEVGSVSASGMEPLNNDGNFHALLRYRIRGGDTVLQKHANTAARSATYQSPDIQNELITAAGDSVKEAVLRRIKKAKFWAILADKTTDRHQREQLAVVVRYLLPDESGAWYCYEDTVAVVDAYATLNHMATDDAAEQPEVRLSGAAIADVLLNIVRQLGLDLSTCVGQGYDGAANLASERVGASAKFREAAPSAQYFHCYMHCLNLSASKAVAVPAIRHAEDIIRTTTKFFRSSAKRTDCLKACIDQAEDTRISKSHLMTLCTTRFIERRTSVLCFRSLLRFILEALDRITL